LVAHVPRFESSETPVSARAMDLNTFLYELATLDLFRRLTFKGLLAKVLTQFAIFNVRDYFRWGRWRVSCLRCSSNRQ